MNIYSFREAKTKDVENLQEISIQFSNHLNKDAINKEGFNIEELHKEDRKLVKANLKNKNYKYYIAELNKKIIGFCYFGIEECNRKEGFIGEIFVLPKHRKKGIATQLIAIAENWLKDNNCTKIQISVNSRDRNALKLYQKLGFVKQKNILIDLSKEIQ